MPIQAPSWTEFLSCPICCNEFSPNERLPISLGCGHTICRLCLGTLHNRQCPYDQTSISTHVNNLPINNALLQLLDNGTNYTSRKNDDSGIDEDVENMPESVLSLSPEDLKNYLLAKKCIESLALHLKSFFSGNYGSMLSRPMQRKIVTLVNCQLMEEEGRIRTLRAVRSLGERSVTELILQHQNPQQLSINLWAAVRSRGCQFLGPAMQEEVLKLVLLVLEDGSALSRKVLVLFVVQRLEKKFPQASKTSIGHVVQLLYRASCFKVSKREADSSLMQLKEEFRTYEALRREHDAQIVQIATEAGLRIAPDQWSALLYGDILHKSHMQSIIDKLQTPSSFAQSVQELFIALQRTGDPAKLSRLHDHLKHLAGIDPLLENVAPNWEEVAKALDAVREVVVGLVEFVKYHGNRKVQDTSLQGNSAVKYKISLCRDHAVRRMCPRGSSCTFAHSEEERERYRAKNRKNPSSAMLSINKCVQNPNTPKKEYFSSHAIHSPHTVILQANDETASSTSTANSPLRLQNTVHGKQSTIGFGDITPPLHPGPSGRKHYMRQLQHSPTPNGKMDSISASILSAQPIRHRFESSLGNYGMQSPTALSTIGVNTPLIPVHTSNSELHPSEYYAAVMQKSNLLPLGNLKAAINPQNHPNMNAITSGISSNTMGANNNPYNYYDSNLLAPLRASPPFFGERTNIKNQNVTDGFNFELGVMPVEQPVNSMWDHHQIHTAENLSNMKNLSLMYEAASAKTLLGKPNFQSSLTIDSQFPYKTSINNNNNNNIKSTKCKHFNDVDPLQKDSIFSSNSDKNRGSYWNAHNTAVANSVINLMVNDGQHQVEIPNIGLNSYCVSNDRTNFVRSDSILDDDVTTFDVASNVTTPLGNKFGPIRPMHKALTPTAPATSLTNYFENWNKIPVPSDRSQSSINNSHNVHLANDSSFSNFSAVKDECQPQPVRRIQNCSNSQNLHDRLASTCMTFNDLSNLQVELANISALELNCENSNGLSNKRLHGTCDTNSSDFSLNALQFMTHGGCNNHNNYLNLNKNSPVRDTLLWSGNSVSSNAVHGKTNSDDSCMNVMQPSIYAADLKESNYWQSSMDSIKRDIKKQNFENDAVIAGENSLQQKISRKSQKASAEQRSNFENSSDSGIDNIMMRDIEIELSEIVDKV